MVKRLQGYIGVRVPKRLKDEIAELVDEGIIFTEAEFVRAALNDKLKVERREV